MVRRIEKPVQEKPHLAETVRRFLDTIDEGVYLHELREIPPTDLLRMETLVHRWRQHVELYPT